MKAYKCDRCGKLFERYDGQATSNFFIMAFNQHCLDLCPDCNDKLQEWFANGKEQVDCNRTNEYKPVINQTYSPTYFCEYGKCPTCGETVSGFSIVSPNLCDEECPKCGQKLKWR